MTSRTLIKRGDKVKVKGIPGKSTFLAFVTAPSGEWCDVFARGHRSVNPDRIYKRFRR